MILELSARDLEAAIGVEFNDSTDLGYAELAARAANSYVNSLPVVEDPAASTDVTMAGLQLAVNLYTRRPAGAVAPEFEFSAPVGMDPIISRLLQLGTFAPPVIA